MTPAGPVSGFPSAWYVAFYGTEQTHWWDWLTPPGFRHCMAFAYAAHAERWLVYDVTCERTFIRAFTRELFPAWLETLPPERKVLHFEAGESVKVAPAWRIGFWCAPAIAHLIGSPSRALRPRALFRDLLAQGARLAFQEPRDDQDQDGSPAHA